MFIDNDLGLLTVNLCEISLSVCLAAIVAFFAFKAFSDCTFLDFIVVRRVFDPTCC